MQCDVFINRVTETWKIRVSIIVYAMCIVATIGWVLFMVFGAIGIVTLPLDWIRSWIGRPRATITRSQYIDRARDLARRAKDILALADALKREERERGRSWRWRRNIKALNTQLLVLEEDEQQLELVYPQVWGPCDAWKAGAVVGGGGLMQAAAAAAPSCLAEQRLWLLADADCSTHPPTLPLHPSHQPWQSEDPDYRWVLTVMGFWLKLFGGLLGLALSICWVLQIILYILIDPPVSPLLNDVFIK